MKPERDPVYCDADECLETAEVATVAGPLCREHADELAEEAWY